MSDSIFIRINSNERFKFKIRESKKLTFVQKNGKVGICICFSDKTL